MGILRKFRRRGVDSSVRIAVGSFKFVESLDNVRVSDAYGYLAHNASKSTSVGQFLSLTMEAAKDGDKRAESWLEAYAVVTYNTLGIVPDSEFLDDLMSACEACQKRHSDLYGAKDDISEEEDAEILKGVQETEQAERELVEAVEKES